MPSAVVFAETPSDRYLAGRSVRALRAAQVGVFDIVRASRSSRVPQGEMLRGGVWFLRAGAWPTASLAPGAAGLLPPSSATGRPLCALGAVRRPPRHLDGAGGPGELAVDWSKLLATTGGDLDREPLAAGAVEVASAYLERPLAAEVLAMLCDGASLRGAIADVLGARSARVVRHAALDVAWDARLRVAQVLPSAQQGGAERIALDLAVALAEQRVASGACVLWRPPRQAFGLPPGTLDLSEWPGGHRARFAQLASALIAWGADLAHVHLLARHDLQTLGALGFTPLVTVHNVRAGWPEGFVSLRADEVALLCGCSLNAAADAAQIASGPPVRCVYNGIDRGAFKLSPETRDRERRRLGLTNDDLVLLAVGNPRPQKRLERLPAVVAALNRLRRNVKLLVAGAPSAVVPASLEADAALRRAISDLGLEHAVRLLGSVDDVRALYRAADVLVSVSGHEGLSLAHLEALAAGLPVVATAAGGTPELAALAPGVTLLPLEASASDIAHAVLASRNAARGAESPRLPELFERASMAKAYARLYPRAVERSVRAHDGRRGDGLWLVTNNFSTGGAQASARRLLRALRDSGVRVRAATLEEQPDYPTPGRRSLIDAKIPVLALPPASASASDAPRAIEELLVAIDADRPAAVVLWNALAEYKVLLADALLDVPLFDVSPGEMYFASLERHFASSRAAPPYSTPADYGARLRGIVVKYAAEAARARDVLGAPVHVIPNGIAARPSRPPQRPRDVLAMGTCVRLHPHKRLEDLIDALRLAAPRMPRHVLKIAGGPDRGCEAYAADLRARARGLAVEWHGEIRDVDGFASELDLFTLVAEPAGCPNASLEAMAHGLAIVATDVGGMSEQVIAGETGWLTPARDVPAFAEALCEAAHDAARRERFGAAGMRRVASHFSVERMARAYSGVLFDA